MCSDMAASHLTLKDIAREVGVSVATLDRVLHGWPGVREETARRVREAIDRHGFRPFAAGAELARSRPHRIAFVMPEGSNVFMSMILDNIADMSGWLTARRDAEGHHVIWADASELRRLGELHRLPRDWANKRRLAELTRPKPRPER